MWFNKKKKYYTTKYLQKHSALFDQLDLVTYEEVETHYKLDSALFLDLGNAIIVLSTENFGVARGAWGWKTAHQKYSDPQTSEPIRLSDST